MRYNVSDIALLASLLEHATSESRASKGRSFLCKEGMGLYRLLLVHKGCILYTTQARGQELYHITGIFGKRAI